MAALKEFKKIESIKQLRRLGLPIPETIFVFDFRKQEKEIDHFLKNKRIVTVRSDRKRETDFCPHNLRCPRRQARQLIRNLTAKGFGVIVQRYIPIWRDRASGNILILKNKVSFELMGTGPLTQLTREGRIEQRVVFRKSDGKRLEHFGNKLIKGKDLKRILKMVEKVPAGKIMEFTLRPEGLYFWQIREDKTAKVLE